MRPKVGVPMDHGTLWDFEDFLHGDGKKSEFPKVQMFF